MELISKIYVNTEKGVGKISEWQLISLSSVTIDTENVAGRILIRFWIVRSVIKYLSITIKLDSTFLNGHCFQIEVKSETFSVRKYAEGIRRGRQSVSSQIVRVEFVMIHQPPGSLSAHVARPGYRLTLDCSPHTLTASHYWTVLGRNNYSCKTLQWHFLYILMFWCRNLHVRRQTCCHTSECFHS